MKTSFHAKPRGLVDLRYIHHQRIALPMTYGISHRRRIYILAVRPSIRGNHAEGAARRRSLKRLLVQENYFLSCLHNLIWSSGARNAGFLAAIASRIGVIRAGVQLFTLGVQFRLVIRRQVGRWRLAYKTSAIKVDGVFFSVRAHLAWRAAIAPCVADDSRQKPSPIQIRMPVRSVWRGFRAGDLHHVGWRGRFLLGSGLIRNQAKSRDRQNA